MRVLMGKSNSKKMSANKLALMILSSIFGFANVTVAYDQMEYASIIWYIFAALVFFLPSSLMFAEYGSAFSEQKGGIEKLYRRSFSFHWYFYLVSWLGYLDDFCCQ